ncbi:efflux RND transporter periplasmic adaptor subunit [Alkalilimnicola sp. S0819]|uniref:efflux RND transporter periplasmic adaptor subunit n=1 Tax=Alkalilimnicola sp. S0819 TaxID=2613922 RepID=UPI0029CA95C6|nr:efflux RND transporter periplasmic adaptor subunit [Alkalilimnicola sp. S0819]
MLVAGCGDGSPGSAAEGAGQDTHVAAQKADADHEDGEDHDDHEGGEDHDEHGDEERIVRLTQKELAEFGIEVRTAEGGAVTVTRQLPGEIVFDPDLVARVTPRVQGVVQEILKRTGDRVQQGDVLAVLASRELAQIKSDYLSAQARLDLVQATFERKQRLAEQQITSEAEVLESRQALREAKLALQLAERKLQALGLSRQQIGELGGQGEAALARYELTAPIAGTVIERHLTRGETTAAEADQPPFVIADTETVWAQLTVYPRDFGAVHAGQKVTVIADGGDLTAEGTIDYVTPQMREATRSATARVVLDNPDGRWRPGQFITARVQVAQAQADVVIPESALQTVEQESVVFVLTDEGFEPRPVRLGRRAEEKVEIEAGLRPGERYAATNTFTLKAEHGREALEGAGHAH